MSNTESWMFDYLQPENAKYFSNPRAEMAPEDYAPVRDRWEDADPEPEYEDDEEED